MSPPPKITRRTLTLGGIAAAGVAVIAGAVYEVPRLFRHRARGTYAELVNLLDDPEQAATVGRAIHFVGDTDPSFEERAQADLKKRLSGKSLATLMAEDSAHLDRMVEADGWVIPLALAEICVLAAESV